MTELQNTAPAEPCADRIASWQMLEQIIDDTITGLRMGQLSGGGECPSAASVSDIDTTLREFGQAVEQWAQDFDPVPMGSALAKWILSVEAISETNGADEERN